jgi:hypothetical protein
MVNQIDKVLPNGNALTDMMMMMKILKRRMFCKKLFHQQIKTIQFFVKSARMKYHLSSQTTINLLGPAVIDFTGNASVREMENDDMSAHFLKVRLKVPPMNFVVRTPRNLLFSVFSWGASSLSGQ